MRRPFALLTLWILLVPAVAPADAVPADEPPADGWRLEWARGAVFYEVFVRSFADSDGNGIGDLRGLADRLDLLNDGDPATSDDLGVDGLWLMPIASSPSYHGYDVVDYEAIEPDYGTLADFEHLLAEAHRRGLKVIVDLVVNHTSSQHPWFRSAAAAPDSPHRGFYVWRGDDPGWTQPWGGSNPTWHRLPGDRPPGEEEVYYYGIFWSGMPDLDHRNPAVRREMARIATLWLDRGLDGFRLDAVRHLVEDGPGAGQADTVRTHVALRELAAAIRRRDPRALVVGEVWTDAPTIATYYGSTAAVPGGDELPAAFDFPLAEAIVAAVDEGDATAIRTALAAIAELYPQGVVDATFLTNHDQSRLASRFAGDPAKLRSAAAVLLTLPGTPFLYYGEEIGLADGRGGGDEAKRTPMPWSGDGPGHGFTSGKPWHDFAPGAEAVNVAAQRHDPDSLLSHTRRLVHLRRAQPALRHGDLRLLETEPEVLAFVRTSAEGAAESAVLVAHNLGQGAVALALPADVAPAERLFAAGRAELVMGAILELGGGASGVWRLDPDCGCH